MDSQITTIRPEGDLTIRDSDGLAKELLAALREQDAVDLDASEITSADVTILQVFIAAHRSAQEMDKTFRLTVPPEGGVAAALKQSGIRSARDIPLLWDGDVWVGIGKRPQTESSE